MKRIGLLASMILLFVGIGMNNASAQKLKLGHVQVDSIFLIMPDRTQAEQELQQYSKQLENKLMTMNAELESKYNEYLEESETWPATMKQDKEEELNGLQQRIQNFQTRAQQDLQTKESELLQPIYEKIRHAIKDVAEEDGFTYIYDASMLLYKSDDSINITKKVKAKLSL
ncbi:MAG: OmpH family outer membrane protein [Bacteroidota bacterium]|nr:OmpH family outer membrane protein [Bacteroidota bacterium]